MKLLRYGGVGAEKPGILGGPGIIRDLSGHVADIDGNFLTNRALDEVVIPRGSCHCDWEVELAWPQAAFLSEIRRSNPRGSRGDWRTKPECFDLEC